MSKPTKRAWVGVISRAHVLRGVTGGFTQVCHGQRGPLARMASGDLFIAYSPTTEMKAGEKIQRFTAIGWLPDDEIFSFDTGSGFVPFRRRVRWATEATEAALAYLRGQLAFTRDSGWGMLARRGHFEIGLNDAAHIAQAMGVTL